MIVRALDLFCGGGGSSWGARAAKVGAVKVEIAYGIDADPVAMAAYARNFGRQKAVHLRMTENTTPSMLRDLGEIHLLLASPRSTPIIPAPVAAAQLTKVAGRRRATS